MAKHLIGTGTTDTNGTATIQYTGTGAGKIDIVAEYTDGESIIQSETYSLWDTIQYDNGYDTDYHDVWVLSANVTMTRTSNGTTFVANGTGANYIGLMKDTDTNQVFIDSTKDFRLEYKLQTSNQIGIYLGTTTNRNLQTINYHNLNLNSFIIDWIKSENKLHIYVNGATTPTYTATPNFNDELVGFRIVDWQGDCNLLLKDFKAYYI